MAPLAQAPAINAPDFEMSWPYKKLAFDQLDQLVWHESITFGREKSGGKVFVKINSDVYPLFHDTTRLVVVKGQEKQLDEIRQRWASGKRLAIRCVMFDPKAENTNNMIQRAIALIPGPPNAQNTDPVETFRKNWVARQVKRVEADALQVKRIKAEQDNIWSRIAEQRKTLSYTYAYLIASVEGSKTLIQSLRPGVGILANPPARYEEHLATYNAKWNAFLDAQKNKKIEDWYDTALEYVTSIYVLYDLLVSSPQEVNMSLVCRLYTGRNLRQCKDMSEAIKKTMDVVKRYEAKK